MCHQQILALFEFSHRQVTCNDFRLCHVLTRPLRVPLVPGLVLPGAHAGPETGARGALFAGRRLRQDADCRVRLSMTEYAESKVKTVEVPRGFIANGGKITDDILRRFKGANGSIGWLASTGRPDLVAAHI